MSGQTAIVATDGLYQATNVQEFGYSAPNITFGFNQVCVASGYGGSYYKRNRVSAAVRDGAIFTYTMVAPYSDDGSNPNPASPYPGLWVFGPTDPLGNSTKSALETNPFMPAVVNTPEPLYQPGAAIPVGLVYSADGTVTNFTTDRSGRVASIIRPEGGTISYTYDARGNLTQIVEAPKPNSSLPSRVSTANYDATCVSPAKCNNPNWVIDANGTRTDYTYDANSGVLLTKTQPPVATSVVTADTGSCKTSAAQPYCVRPQTRLS